MSRLTADDWTRAGLRALARGGLPAVAVEPLAAELGASKGSFYWHFDRRDDLVVAVIARWEAATESIITEVERVGGSPQDRMRALFERVFADHPENAAERAVLAATDDSRVAAALHRVVRRRIDFLVSVLAELGRPPAETRRRAALAYSAYVGHLQLQQAAPAVLRDSTGSMRGYADVVVGLLLGEKGDR